MNFKFKLDSFILIEFFEFRKYYIFYFFFCFVLTTVLIQNEVVNNSQQDFFRSLNTLLLQSNLC